MRILVDEMPRKEEDCCFYNGDIFKFPYGCTISGRTCTIKKCRYLKEFKPVKDDCK